MNHHRGTGVMSASPQLLFLFLPNRVAWLHQIDAKAGVMALGYDIYISVVLNRKPKTPNPDHQG